MQVKYMILSILVVLVSAFYLNQKSNSSECDTSTAILTDHCDMVKTVPTSRDFKTMSTYVEMRDGVKLAVDIYLPSGHVENMKYPTMLHFTRYYRSWALQWPFGLIFGESMNTRSIKYVEKFVQSGYVWVSVDVRGTGASFGTRRIDFDYEEVEDYKEILQWVVRQKWCDGNIGSTGISYDGIAAVILAAMSEGIESDVKGTISESPVKAIAPLYSPIDLYRDLIAPGGIHCKGFTDSYGDFTYNLERALMSKISTQLPFKAKFLFDYVLEGVLYVTDPFFPGDTSGPIQLRKEAIEQHSANWDMVDVINQMTKSGTICIDDEMILNGESFEFQKLIPTKYVDVLKKLRIPVYIFSAYYDSASVESALYLYHSLENSERKLTLGPWTHGGRRNSSPFSKSTEVCYDMYSDLVNYFDCYLKPSHKCTNDSPDVNYFVIGRESWNSADTFPVKAEWKDFYFDKNNRLSEVVPNYEEEKDVHHVSQDTYTHQTSRWNLIDHFLEKSVSYPERKEQGEKLLTYTTDLLKANVTFAGSPVVTFSMAIDAPDGQFFAYLEDIDEEGNVFYVSEGSLRSTARKRSETISQVDLLQRGIYGNEPEEVQEIMKDTIHSFKRVDILATEPNQSYTYSINLHSTAWSFLQGHRIRISLAGVDTVNFTPLKNQPTTWTLSRGTTTPSRLLLPTTK